MYPDICNIKNNRLLLSFNDFSLTHPSIPIYVHLYPLQTRNNNRCYHMPSDSSKSYKVPLHKRGINVLWIHPPYETKKNNPLVTMSILNHIIICLKIFVLICLQYFYFKLIQISQATLLLSNHQRPTIFKNLTILTTLPCLTYLHLVQQTQRLPFLKIAHFFIPVKSNTQRLI